MNHVVIRNPTRFIADVTDSLSTDPKRKAVISIFKSIFMLGILALLEANCLNIF